MWATKSRAKKQRNMKRLITFLQAKILSPTTQSLTICHQSNIDLPPKPSPLLTKSKLDYLSIPPKIPKKPCLSLVCVETTDIPPADQIFAPYLPLPSSLKEVSIRNQPPPQSAILPNNQTYCTTCHKIFGTKDDEKYHQETQYGREDCYLLRSMLP